MKIKIKSTEKKEQNRAFLKSIPEYTSSVQKGHLWDLYEDGVTQSMLSDFLRCPELFRLKNVVGVEPSAEDDEAIQFGNFFHETRDVLYSKFKDCESRTKFVKNVDSIIEESIDLVYDDTKKLFKIQGNNVATLNRNYMIAKPLFTAYIHKWREEDFVLRKWLSLEEIFEIEYVSKVTKKVIKIRGKFDGTFEGDDSLEWLEELKTKAMIVEASISAKLNFDLQVFVYLWCLSVRNIGNKSNVYPGGVLYDLVRRPMLRQKVNESDRQFATRVEKDIKDRPTHYFTRMYCSVTKYDIIKWFTEFTSIMTQFEKWYLGEYHYKNPNSCTSTSMGNCKFLPLCGLNRIEMYKKKNELFRELKVLK